MVVPYLNIMNQPAEKIEVQGPLKTMTAVKLNRSEISHKGEEIPSVLGQLLSVPELEDTLWRIPLELITANPDQPRTYFRPDKLQELEVSIRAKGVQVPVQLAPYLDQQSGGIRLFMIDGERRFRVCQSIPTVTIKGIIRCVLTLEELFEDSLIINEGRDPHNPIERARAYKRLIEYKEKRGEQSAVQQIAKKLAISDQTIYNHLRLLDLPEEIQALVIRDQVPTSELFHLANVKKKFGDQIDLLRVARILLDNLHKDTPARVTPKGITAKGVRDAAKQALLEGGNEALANEIESQRSIYQLLNGLNGTLKAAETIVRESARQDVVRILRSRRSPPEVLRDRIDATLQQLGEIRDVVNTAIMPDPLPEVPGKPKFADFVREKTAQKFGNSLTRYKLALAIARSSDQKEIVSTTELVEYLKSDINTVASNLRILEDELKELGIKIEPHTIREKDSRDIYDKKVAYRLVWVILRPSSPILPPASRVSLSTPRLPLPPSPPRKAVSAMRPQTLGLAAFMPKANAPSVTAKVILLEDTVLKGEVLKGEKTQVREHVPELYSAIKGQRVLVLDPGVSVYQDLRTVLNLGLNEVIVILLDEPQRVSKVHPKLLVNMVGKVEVDGCKILSFNEELAKLGKTLKERIQKYISASELPRMLVPANLDNDYYRVLRGEEVVIIPHTDAQYGALANELGVMKGEVVVALVNVKNSISKVRKMILQYKVGR